MHSLYNITLILPNRLDKTLQSMWIRTIARHVPRDIIMECYAFHAHHAKYKYVMDISRALFDYEIDAIMEEWSSKYSHNFNVETTQRNVVNKTHLKRYVGSVPPLVKDDSESKVKNYYNRWIDFKISEGWRYGQTYNENDKVSPNLLKWDNLGEEFKSKIKEKYFANNQITENKYIDNAVNRLQKYWNHFLYIITVKNKGEIFTTWEVARNKSELDVITSLDIGKNTKIQKIVANFVLQDILFNDKQRKRIEQKLSTFKGLSPSAILRNVVALDNLGTVMESIFRETTTAGAVASANSGLGSGDPNASVYTNFNPPVRKRRRCKKHKSALPPIRR